MQTFVHFWELFVIAFSAMHKYYCTGYKSDISAASLTTFLFVYAKIIMLQNF